MKNSDLKERKIRHDDEFRLISSIFTDQHTYDIFPIIKNSKQKGDSISDENNYEQKHVVYKRQSSNNFGLDYLSKNDFLI